MKNECKNNRELIDIILKFAIKNKLTLKEIEDCMDEIEQKYYTDAMLLEKKTINTKGIDSINNTILQTDVMNIRPYIYYDKNDNKALKITCQDINNMKNELNKVKTEISSITNSLAAK